MDRDICSSVENEVAPLTERVNQITKITSIQNEFDLSTRIIVLFSHCYAYYCNKYILCMNININICTYCI